MRHEPKIHPMIATAPGQLGLELNLGEVAALLRQHWKTIACSVIACLALASVYLFVTPAQYTATTQLLIDARSNVLPNQQVRATDANAESAHVETQAEILRSDRIARAVIVSEELTKLPQFSGVRRLPWSRTSESSKQPETPAERTEAERGVSPSAVKAFHSRLSVKRNAATHIIEITYRDSDPKLAAKVANAVVASYLAEQLRQRDDIIRNASHWLKQRAVDLLSEAHAAETALLKFRSTNSASDAASRIILRDLETTAQTYRWFSENFQKRFLETSQNMTFNLADARVISEAWPPTDKSHPKSLLVLAIAVAAGLSIGFLLALFLGKSEEADA